jgi:carbonic anhydrase
MSLDRLLDNNAAWSDAMVHRDPLFFTRLQAQQKPEYLWIGCSDSRVPANEIVGLAPGEVFVHRNIANLVVHTDLNCLSVLQFAVDILRVKHVIVTGHYGCGGIRAVMDDSKLGLIDNWLRHIREVRDRHARALAALPSSEAMDRLCELNVIEQARHVCETTIVQDAWTRQQALSVHGLIYGLGDGRLRQVGFAAAGPGDVGTVYKSAVRGTLAAS